MLDRPDAATAAALARLYDLDLSDDPGDVDLYLALADRADGPVIELAAGSGRLAIPLAAAGHTVTAVDLDPAMTGRLAIPLAAAGHTVTAVDLDPAMLARGRARAVAEGLSEDRLRFEEADLVELRMPDAGRYALAFIALNSLMLLPDRASQAAAFATLAAHLAPGGLAAVDVWLPDAEDLGRFDGRMILEWPRIDPETGHVVTKTGTAIHDVATGTVALTAIYDEGPQGAPPVRWVRTDRLRLVAADELVAFAEAAGLRVETVAGGYDLHPLGPGSERAIVIAVKPDAP